MGGRIADLRVYRAATRFLMDLPLLISQRAPSPIACGRFARRSVAVVPLSLDLAGDGVELLANAGRLLRLPAPVEDGRADVQGTGEVDGEGAQVAVCQLLGPVAGRRQVGGEVMQGLS